MEKGTGLNNLKKPTNRLGKYAKSGGPGRPKGSKNKFTKIKEAIADAFFAVGGKDRLIKESKSKQGFRYLMKDVVSLMPKETQLSGDPDQDSPITLKVITFGGKRDTDTD
ncbi:MAG: hypothetical protein KAX15_04005 [Candidatus Omnitrophica bacterium]|nr:hypothetical protein [Candidatus Omnitrophota bacterium]